MRKITALLLSFSLLLVLAGCGAQAEASPETEAVESVQQTAEAVKTEETTAQTVQQAAETEQGTAETAAEKTIIRIAGLKGPTSMGMVRLMEKAEEGIAANAYSFSLHGSADEITPKLIQGELDMAALPANLASVLYNNTNGAVRVLAVNTLGVLYIVERGEAVSTLADLKGKTVYCTGKGSTPEYTLRWLLSQNGIDPDQDLTLEFKSEPAEVVSVLAAQEDAVAMLPQPYVTAASAKVEGLRTAIDLTKEWNSLEDGSQLITGVMVARSEFIEQNPEAVSAFLADYEDSVSYVLANTQEAAQLCEAYDITKAAIAEKALPLCNITFLKGQTMKEALSGYLGTLYEQNPKAVGGQLPADDFYYVDD